MPYEEMYSGESLIRQFYLGARWIEENLDGYFPNTYWNPDVPGRTMQMAQIMAKSGTKNLVISRHKKGVYKWYSPDGSFVYAYSPGHYSEDFSLLGKSNFTEIADLLAGKLLYWEDGYNDKPGIQPVIPVLSDWDMSPAKDYSKMIEKWNTLDSYTNKNGMLQPLKLPDIKLATASEFIGKINESTIDLPVVISGERPAVWLYIHGPSHEWALKASREGDIMMTIAEKFSTIDALLRNTFAGYPEERLGKAWESKIYPDHGWGGKGGESTDAITLSSSTAVADYVDPTGLSGGALVLQPIMLASRRSCHGEGNEYLQTGSHFYHFSFTSHKPGFQNGFRFGRQSNEKLMSVVNPVPARENTLPESLSFFSVDAGNISISTIKKAEDGNEAVVRLYENGIAETKANLKSWFSILHAEKTSMIEYDGTSIQSEKNSVPLIIGGHSIETLKLSLK